MAASLARHISKIRSPLGGEKVYKDECMFSFDTPESETGLYVCMHSFMGFGKKHVQRYFETTGNAVFLHMRKIRRELPEPEESEEVPKKKLTKMAIGVEGGFESFEKKFDIEEMNTIVVLPDWTQIPLSNAELPGEVQISAAAIIAVESASKLADAAALAGQWEGEKRVISKYADNLPQQNIGRKIPPRGWKCEKCDLTDNLWLNLTDGSILCGRKFWDGTGGNNHAVDHYNEVKHPLAVKLGTITPDGADVHSYAEDNMVEDPQLAKHLAHFGIDIMKMEKTDKTMVELEINANQKILEWDVIQEAGSKLEPVYGAGYTGLHNLGNSCYMNSVMQVIFNIPDFVSRYCGPAQRVFEEGSADPANNFNVQMCKFGHGLLSGEYSKPPEQAKEEGPSVIKPVGVRPQMFKTLIGQGHPEFSTKRQQDAQEFLLHLINTIERNSRTDPNPCESLRHEVEERIQCVGSGQVRYTQRTDYLLSLPIPLEAATNLEQVAEFEAKKKELEEEKKHVDPKDTVRPRIPLQACLDAFAAPEMVEDFYSSALKAQSTAQKTTRLLSLPDYLMIHMKKFTLGEDWVPKKLDVSLDMPDTLDLTSLRGHGLQPGEQELPDESASQQAAPVLEIDQGLVAQLAEMGFPFEGCRRAVFHTKNSGVEAAMNWVMGHLDDADLASPFMPQGSKTASDKFVPDPDGLAMISAMGFSTEQAAKALKATNNNVERAADWIFSHPEEPMDIDQGQGQVQQAAASAAQFRDGSGKYQLVAFISHMGTSTLVGHYLCHILREGRWVIYNDDKVALSEKPPKDLAYLYLYKRV